MRIESKFGGVRLDEVPHGGTGAGEHQNSERSLPDDERRSCPGTMRSRAARSRRLDHIADARIRKLQSWKKASEDSNRNRNSHAEQKNRRIQRYYDFVGN